MVDRILVRRLSNLRCCLVLLLLAIALAAASMVARTLFFANGPATATWLAVIDGGSMAESLVGEHFSPRCPDCGIRFRCDVQGTSVGDLLVCPNCGYRRVVIAEADRRDADRVRAVDRNTPPDSSAPPPVDRWSLVALRGTTDSQSLFVKRIVGTPGETLAIRDGDLFANDQILRKPLTVLRDVAILVHHDAYRPRLSGTLPARWSADDATSRWQPESVGFAFTAASARDEPDWLVYRHWRCFESPRPRTEESPILDNDPFNPRASRELNDVRDLLLSFRMTPRESARHPNGLLVSIRFEQIEPAIQIELYRDELRITHGVQPARTKTLPASFRESQTSLIEVAFFDQQVVAAIDNAEIVSIATTHTTLAAMERRVRPIRLGARDYALNIDDLKLARDIYYLPPASAIANRAWRCAEPLRQDEYFVLGDNPTISRDSRDPEFGSVPRDRMLGISLERIGRAEQLHSSP